MQRSTLNRHRCLLNARSDFGPSLYRALPSPEDRCRVPNWAGTHRAREVKRPPSRAQQRRPIYRRRCRFRLCRFWPTCRLDCARPGSVPSGRRRWCSRRRRTARSRNSHGARARYRRPRDPRAAPRRERRGSNGYLRRRFDRVRSPGDRRATVVCRLPGSEPCRRSRGRPHESPRARADPPQPSRVPHRVP